MRLGHYAGLLAQTQYRTRLATYTAGLDRASLLSVHLFISLHLISSFSRDLQRRKSALHVGLCKQDSHHRVYRVKRMSV